MSASGDLFGAPPPRRHSLFFALLPDAATVAALRAARQALEAELPPQRGRGVPDGKLHLTLHWLGEWSQPPQATVDAAREAAAAVRVPRFSVTLDTADCFGRCEAVWVLRGAASPPLLALHGTLATELAQRRVRVPPGSGFAPHVTLRRRASVRIVPRPLPPVHWTVGDFALLESVRGPGSAGYRLLGRWPLQAG